MNWGEGIVVYLIAWWMVFFMVLPWGNRPDPNPKPGHVESAPRKPRLWLKAGVTTVITAVVWGLIYVAVEADVFSFRELARR